MKYNKIRIVGASGSGKTYLGEKLSEHFSYPFTPIDDLAYDFSETKKFVKKRSFEERQVLTKKFLKNKTWIIDGSYYTHAKNTYDKADIIIFLDVPFIIRFYNVWKRFIIRIFKGRYEGFQPLMSLLNYNIKSRKKWGPRLELLKKEYENKLKIFKSNDEAYEWLIKQ